MTNDAARPRNPETPVDWEALARYLSGESSVPERERIEQYLAEHPADANVLTALDNAMRILALRRAPEIDVESALERVVARRDAPEPSVTAITPRRTAARAAPRTTRWPWGVTSILAAAAVIVLAARAVLKQEDGTRTESGTAGARTYATTIGKRDSLRLPDGGRVILGPASRLTVAQGYGHQVREVELHGEAYFDIVHDTTHPFVVRLASASVRDVGTAFTVHEDGARVRVAVTAGSVLLRATAAGQQDILRAGDVGAVEPGGRLVTTRDVATAPYLSWMQGSLVFRDAPIAEVGSDLRRWYGIVLRVDDSTLARKHLTMTFSGDPVDRVLRIISLGLGAGVELRGDTAILRRARPQ